MSFDIRFNDMVFLSFDNNGIHVVTQWSRTRHGVHLVPGAVQKKTIRISHMTRNIARQPMTGMPFFTMITYKWQWILVVVYYLR